MSEKVEKRQEEELIDEDVEDEEEENIEVEVEFEEEDEEEDAEEYEEEDEFEDNDEKEDAEETEDEFGESDEKDDTEEDEEDKGKEKDEEKSVNKYLKWLNIFQCRILCGFPIELMEWHDPSFQRMSYVDQYYIIQDAYLYGYGLDKEYKLNFLERFIQELKRIGKFISHHIIRDYDKVKQQVTNGITEIYAYKHYLVTAESKNVTLKEIKNSIAEASTGLHSGPASLALTDYLLHNKENVKQCNIMELGAGAGLCGFMLKKCCDVGTVLLTDGSMECVELMKLNLRLNFPDYAEENEGEIQIKKLIWKEMETSNLVELVKPDIILAADVVFNDWEDLSCAVDFVFTSMKQATLLLLAATVNNEQTLDKFLQKLESLNFFIIDEPISEASESFLHWDRSTPIRILLITRGNVYS